MKKAQKVIHIEDTERLSKELATALKGSEEYKSYQFYRQLLQDNPDLEREVNELRKQNFELQNSDIEDGYEAVEDIRRRFEYVRSNDLANDFLIAESSFCRMVQNTLNSIITEIDFNVDFLK